MWDENSPGFWIGVIAWAITALYLLRALLLWLDTRRLQREAAALRQEPENRRLRQELALTRRKLAAAEYQIEQLHLARRRAWRDHERSTSRQA